MAIREESKRSSMPPWPGKMLPLSLIPNVRLNNDSTKSPQVPNTTTTKPKPNHSQRFRVDKFSPCDSKK